MGLDTSGGISSFFFLLIGQADREATLANESSERVTAALKFKQQM